MSAERRPARGGAAHLTAARRSTRTVFQPTDIPGCIRIDLTRPSNGDTFASGEVGRRIYHAVVGMTPDVTLQLVVSPSTPMYDPQVPADVRVQVVAPDAQTLSRWRSAIAEARA